MENQGQQMQMTAAAGTVLSQVIAEKLDYLSTFQAAVTTGDDRQIYELLDPSRYQREVKKVRSATVASKFAELVADSHADISHYLSDKLIDYLGQTYPFFYYDEYETGRFHIYFGNWWDRRLFGELDVLQVAFKFDEEEYHKLSQSFALEAQHQRYNSERIDQLSTESEHLQQLIATQDKRDQQKETLRAQLKENGQKSAMPWEASRLKEERQAIVDQLSALADEDDRANNAHKLIKENDEQILVLSKEDTILNYEKSSIRETFDDFEHFEAHNQSLYADYLNSLLGKAQVKSDD